VSVGQAGGVIGGVIGGGGSHILDSYGGKGVGKSGSHVIQGTRAARYP
jgi:hypothetical protein